MIEFGQNTSIDRQSLTALTLCEQEGEYRDPFQDAERQERERANAARSRSPLIPPVQAQTGANPDQNGPPQLQLTNAATSPIAGVALYSPHLQT